MSLPNSQSFLTIKQASEVLETSVKTLRRLEKRGVIKPKKGASGKFLFSQKEIYFLQGLLKSQTSNSTFSILEAAKLLGVSLNTLRRWEKDGLIKGERTPGGHRRYSLSEIEKVKISVKKYQPRNITLPVVNPIQIINEARVRGFELSDAPVLYSRFHIDQKKVLFVAAYLFLFSLFVTGGVKAGRVFGFLSETSFLNTGKETSLSVLKPQGSVLQAASVVPTFTVSIESEFRENVRFLKNTFVTGNVNVTGDTDIGGSLTLGGQLVVPTTLDVSGEATLDSSLSVAGNLNQINGVDYTWPSAQGSSSTFLKNDGTGDLSWGVISSTANLTDVTGTLGFGNGGTGSTTTLAAGSVIFSDGTKLTQDNTNLFWDDSNNQLEIGSGGSIIPSVNIGADLGTSSLKWNNLYVANINADSALTISGQGIFTYDPTDTTFAQASIRINPTAPSANEQLLGMGQGGEERAAFDAEGDLSIGYDGSAGSSVPTTSNPLMVYGHNTTNVASIDTTGNLSIAGAYSGTSGTNMRLQATGTTTGNTNNSSIYFLDSTGTTRGRFDTQTQIASLGTGADGAITVSQSSNCQTGTGSFSSALCKAIDLTAGAAIGTNVITVSSTTGFSVGDEIMIIQMEGTGIGNYETKRISAVTSTTGITLSSTVTKAYQSTDAQIVRIPNFTTVSVSSGGTITTSAWNGTTGGVLFLRATTSITVASGGIIDMNALGGPGGGGGPTGIGVTQTCNGTNRAGPNGTSGTVGTAGSGSGGGTGGGITNNRGNGGTSGVNGAAGGSSGGGGGGGCVRC